jgi:hypothetical protein
MVSKLTEEDRNALCFEAMRLLLDNNLVWSNDFEEIRPALASLFMKAMSVPQLAENITTLAARVVKTYG